MAHNHQLWRTLYFCCTFTIGYRKVELILCIDYACVVNGANGRSKTKQMVHYTCYNNKPPMRPSQMEELLFHKPFDSVAKLVTNVWKADQKKGKLYLNVAATCWPKTCGHYNIWLSNRKHKKTWKSYPHRSRWPCITIADRTCAVLSLFYKKRYKWKILYM